MSVLLVLLTGCLTSSEVPVHYSDQFEMGISLGLVDDERLKEVSGLAASRNYPGMLWVHNDSGNPAEIYLLDSQSAVRATWVLGNTQRDWEDMAIGPGPDDTKNYVYVGDIGDNFTIYAVNYIYRFPEPTIPLSNPAQTDTLHQVDTITFVYPDEQWDAETLLLDPLTKDLYLLTKEMFYLRVYRLPYPQPTDSRMVAELITTLPFRGANWLDRLVSGDISADGQEMLLKTYQHVFYRTRTDSALALADWLAQPADTLAYLVEFQGEAIGFSADGSGYYTLSESQVGTDLHLYFYPRQPGSR